MPKRGSKGLLNREPSTKWTAIRKPLMQSFSLPKGMHNKKISLVQQRNQKIIQECNDFKSSTDLDNDWISSNEEVLDSSEDFEDLSSGETEYSSIEVPRSAGTFYSDLSTDILLAKQSVLSDAICSDVHEFLSNNKPVAVSTPIKKTSSSVRNISEVYSFFEKFPVDTSTPKLNRGKNAMKHGEIENFKLLKEFWDESTIKEETIISFVMPPEKNSQGFSLNIEDQFQKASTVSIPIPDGSGVTHGFTNQSIKYPDGLENFKCKEVNKFSKENSPVNAKEFVEATSKRPVFLETKKKVLKVLEKRPIFKSKSSEIKRTEPKRKDEKGLKNISICCLVVSPPSKTIKTANRHEKDALCNGKKSAEKSLIATTPNKLENKRSEFSKFKLARTRSSFKDRLKKTPNVSICCLGTLECVLSTLDMNIPSISVKNALQVLNKKL